MLSVLLQVSLLVHPLYLGEQPPELRSARNILVLGGGTLAAPATSEGAEEAALALARDLVARLRADASFEALAAEHSADVNARDGAVLGTFAPGMLAPALDAFLFQAEVGEISEPLPVAGGVQILERVERQAAVLQILFAGPEPAAAERCARARERLAEGTDFADLARELSDDPVSAARGGALAVYERGRRDKLLKRAAFAAEVGEVVGPVRTPLGLHLLKRVPLEEVDPALAEGGWIRVRAILVQDDLAAGADPALARSADEARRLVLELHRRIQAGEDMAALACEVDDDPTGKERAGDLGWIHRQTPDLPPFLDRLFLARPGELQGLVRADIGWLVLRRER